jgi:putative ABC transport system substrate-binding protein
MTKTIGFLGATTLPVWSDFVAAFQQRLRELGWIDGSNVNIEFRWAEGDEANYAKYASEFVQLGVDVIVTSGTPPTLRAKQKTAAIPIVFASAGDPVHSGLVASLAQPGGNVTGLSNQQTENAEPRLKLLLEALPTLRHVAVLGNVNADAKNVKLEMDAVRQAAQTLGLTVHPVHIRTKDEIFPGLQGVAGQAAALYVCTDPLVTTYLSRINTFAISQKLATMYAFEEYVEAGGLMSYGANFPALFRRAGDYVDKILKGTQPTNIPVELPTKSDLIINLITAQAIGLNIPTTLKNKADKLIQ